MLITTPASFAAAHDMPATPQLCTAWAGLDEQSSGAALQQPTAHHAGLRKAAAGASLAAMHVAKHQS